MYRGRSTKPFWLEKKKKLVSMARRKARFAKMSSNARLSHADFTMTGPAALSTHAILQRAARGDGAARVVTLDPAFQGLPDTAHGGTVLALFDAVAATAGARTLAGVYRRRVPLATPLTLAIDRDATRFRLSDGGT